MATSKTWRNIRAYFTGNIRHSLYYSPFRFLIPSYIKEQFEYRVSSMRTSCYAEGSCQECGCTTTNLQMANKACAGDCYPPLLSSWRWQVFKTLGVFYDKKNTKWLLDEEKGILIKNSKR